MVGEEIPSNRDAPELGALFGDPLLASAALDRLLHHAHVLVLEGESFRNPARHITAHRNKENRS